MSILITLDYNTSWGEKLFLRNGSKKYEMRYIYAGTWQIGMDKMNGSTYSFEVWKNNVCIRTEWRAHRLPAKKAKVLIIRDKWIDRPVDSPFYSSMFKDVMFKRQTPTASGAKRSNVIITFTYPNIRPEHILAITGNLGCKLEITKTLPFCGTSARKWFEPSSQAKGFLLFLSSITNLYSRSS